MEVDLSKALLRANCRDYPMSDLVKRFQAAHGIAGGNSRTQSLSARSGKAAQAEGKESSGGWSGFVRRALTFDTKQISAKNGRCALHRGDETQQ
jgi:hypothetical protein